MVDIWLLAVIIELTEVCVSEVSEGIPNSVQRSNQEGEGHTSSFVAGVTEKVFWVGETQQTVKVCMKQHPKLQNSSILQHILKKERRQVYQSFYCIHCRQGIIEVWSAVSTSSSLGRHPMPSNGSQCKNKNQPKNRDPNNKSCHECLAHG